jgi:hypothetical protein
MKMPEPIVFARAFGVGLVVAEVMRLAFTSADKFSALIADVDWRWRTVGVILAAAICISYVVAREGWGQARRLAKSKRFDLLAMLMIGLWANELVVPWLAGFHKFADAASPMWPPTLLSVFLLMMGSALWRTYFRRKKIQPPQLYFLADDEIRDQSEDMLGINTQVATFAETVLASGSHAGLVIGVDGLWGTGKTSFINLAQQYWENKASDEVIVIRFEPLRYVTESDLADRFIRDLTATIQRHVYVPEFRPAASRYSRMLRAKTDFSFLGVKISLEPSSETIDELLDDIDDVLKRIRRRVVVVIDDLDRLEPKAVNTVLFTVRRTFRLTQAVYVLCYDTENLVASKDEGARAREFLEKFVNVKLSLLIDSSAIRDFLLKDWRNDESKYQAIPSDTMAKLSSILSVLSEILGDDTAAQYMPVLGDLRKVKRFVNAILLMQIEKTDLAKTDFNSRDLVNLMLLHLHYPGTFRQIYAEETDDRSGSFSVKREHEDNQTKFVNAAGLAAALQKYGEGASRFLLMQLFDVETLGLAEFGDMDESVLASRACFNADPHRNLQSYLRLIVRFSSPEQRDTFKLYQEAVDRVVNSRDSIESILSQPEFNLSDGELAHDQFWRVLVSRSYDFTKSVAEDAIGTLVNYLPRYSSVDAMGRGLRPRSVYSLVRLLDRAGWGRTSGKRKANTQQNIIEVAHRILGDQNYSGRSLIDQLASEKRGVLGWNDLMLFRLQCSADRGGQNFNLQNALILRDNPDAQTAGLVTVLALNGMRTFSQRVFAWFQESYIKSRRNFLEEVDKTSDASFFGDSVEFLARAASGDSERLSQLLLGAKSMIKTFVIYQLANRKPPNGAGVGCGFYDPTGTADVAGIWTLMNQYMFKVCFNPDVHEDNVLHFIDYCLCKLTSSFFSNSDEDGYVATPQGLADELDARELVLYWAKHAPAIRKRNLLAMDRRVVTLNYTATYKEDLPRVFQVLDNMHAAPDRLHEHQASAGSGESE